MYHHAIPTDRELTPVSDMAGALAGRPAGKQFWRKGEVLRKTALYVNNPVNASLPEALLAATGGDMALAVEAAEMLARSLRRHVRDLAWWDRSHTRAQVAARLTDAAMRIQGVVAVTR